MTTPQEQRAKAGAKLGSQLEFFTVETTLDITPGMKSAAQIKAEVDAIEGSVPGMDFNSIAKELPSQTRLDMFVATINEFAQPVIMTFAAGKIMFAFEHVGCATVAKIEKALASAIVVHGDAADVAAAAGMITVSAQ
jgi:hypothetical protein